jgi:hypothetical protein
MLGDDDGLVPGYFSTCLRALECLDNPEFIFHGAYQFAYPGALNEAPKGYLQEISALECRLGERQGQPYMLPKTTARAIAQDALNMCARYSFNMQHFLFSRSFVKRMKAYGLFFKDFSGFYVPCIYAHCRAHRTL